MMLMFFFLMIRRPPRSTQSRSSAASDVYKRQLEVLPQTVQVIAVTLLPLTQLVIITRSLTLSSLSPLFFYSLLWIIMVTALCFILSLRLMRRRLIV